MLAEVSGRRGAGSIVVERDPGAQLAAPVAWPLDALREGHDPGGRAGYLPRTRSNTASSFSPGFSMHWSTMRSVASASSCAGSFTWPFRPLT